VSKLTVDKIGDFVKAAPFWIVGASKKLKDGAKGINDCLIFLLYAITLHGA
jgi:hypothetical protein